MRDRLLRGLDASQPALQIAAGTAPYWIWGVVVLFLLSAGFGMGTGGPFRWLAAILVLAAAAVTHLSRTDKANQSGRVSERPVAMLRSRADHFERSAMIDDATGALRRRGFEEAIAAEHDRLQAAPESPDAALILVVLGRLPAREGALPAEGVELRALATMIRSFVRFGDVVGRVAEDQLAILLYAVSLDKAWRVARRIEEALAHDALPGEAAVQVAFARVGVASLRRAANPEAAHAAAKRECSAEDDRPLFPAKAV